MTAHEIAVRAHARQTGEGKWIARCPAHVDRRPSLTISIGRDDRTLLHCWAGCQFESITAALGISVADLFSRPNYRRNASAFPQLRRPPTAKEIRHELCAEADRAMKDLEQRGIVGDLLTTEIEAVRQCVAIKHSLYFPPLRRSPYEGSYGGRDRDPLWGSVLESAWTSTCVETLGFSLLSLNEHDEAGPHPPTRLLIAAEDRAAALMREMERRQSGSEAAP